MNIIKNIKYALGSTLIIASLIPGTVVQSNGADSNLKLTVDNISLFDFTANKTSGYLSGGNIRFNDSDSQQGGTALNISSTTTSTAATGQQSLNNIVSFIKLQGGGHFAKTLGYKMNTGFSSTSGSYILDNIKNYTSILQQWGQNSRHHTLTTYMGYNSGASSPDWGNGGTISGEDWRHFNATDFADYGGTVTMTTGIWIAKQTRGEYNYGIVLEGDDSGSDIAFGPNQESRVYSVEGELFAQDGVGNITQISPHDSETGEWIYY